MKVAVLEEIERLKQLYSSLEDVEGGALALRASQGSRDSAFGLASSVSGSFSGMPGSQLGVQSLACEDPYVWPSTRISNQPTALTSWREQQQRSLQMRAGEEETDRPDPDDETSYAAERRERNRSFKRGASTGRSRFIVKKKASEQS